MSILKFLGFGKAEPRDPDLTSRSKEIDTIRKIVGALESLEPDRAKQLAAFAFILSRVANADSHISEEETREMERVVMKWGHLPEEQAVLVVQIAKHQNMLFGGTENYIVTREFTRMATPEQKEELLHCLFAVSAADESISTLEEATVAQIAKELGLSHRDQIEIRSHYRDKRAVFQKDES